MQLLALLASLGLDLGASRIEKRRGRGAAMSFALLYFCAAIAVIFVLWLLVG